MEKKRVYKSRLTYELLESIFKTISDIPQDAKLLRVEDDYNRQIVEMVFEGGPFTVVEGAQIPEIALQ